MTLERENHIELEVYDSAGGGSSHGQRREGELDGIDQDFDETQIEIQFAGKLRAICTVLPPVAQTSQLQCWPVNQQDLTCLV